MEKITNFIKNKGIGFYLVLVNILLAFILGIVFFATYATAMGNNAAGQLPELIGWFTFIGALVEIIALVLAKYKLVHILAMVAFGIALMKEVFLIPNLIADAVNKVAFQGGNLGVNLFYLISLLVIMISGCVVCFLGLYKKEAEEEAEKESLKPNKADTIKIGCSAAALVIMGIVAGVSLGNVANNPAFTPSKVVILDDIQKSFQDKVNKDYDFDPESVIWKEDTHPYRVATPQQIQNNVSGDFNRFNHHKVYEFEGKYTEAYQQNFNYSYSYLYLWEDGLFNGSANGSTVYGYWYNRTAEGDPCLVMKGSDGSEMVCEKASAGDKYYDYFTDLKTSLNGGRTFKMNGYLYTPAIGIYIDTGSKEEQTCEFLEDVKYSQWKVYEVRNDLRYGAVLNPGEITWSSIDNMKVGKQQITASWKEFDDQEEAFTATVDVTVGEDKGVYNFTYLDSVKRNYRYIDLFDETGITLKRTVGTGEDAVTKQMDLSKIEHVFDYANNKITFNLPNNTKQSFDVTYDLSEASNTIHTTIDEKDAEIVVTSPTTAKITSDGKTATVKIALTGTKGLATIELGEKVSGEDSLITALPKTFGMSEDENHVLTLASEKYFRSTSKMNSYSQSTDSFVIMGSDPSFVYVIWQFSYQGVHNEKLKLSYTMNANQTSITLNSVVDGVDTEGQWQWCNNKTLNNLTPCQASDLPFNYKE